MKIYFIYGFDNEANPIPCYATLNENLAKEGIKNAKLKWIEEIEINNTELTDLLPS